MRYLLLIVLLTFMQASPPIPRKAPNSPASTTQNVESQSKPNKTPAPSLPLANSEIKASPAQGNSPNQGDRDKKNSVSVAELPPVSITKDWTDRAIWAFSGLLVIVGILQAWLLYLTWRQIRRQAGEMARQRRVMRGQLEIMKGQLSEAKASADATKRSVELFINKERAKLFVEPVYEGFCDFDPGKNYGLFAEVGIKVTHYGPTPAFEVKCQCETVFTNCPSLPPKNLIHSIDLPKIIKASGDPVVGSVYVPLPDDDTIKKVDDGEMFAHFYGIVTYSDIFGEQRETTFRYTWRPQTVIWGDDADPSVEPLVIGTAGWELTEMPEDNHAG